MPRLPHVLLCSSRTDLLAPIIEHLHDLGCRVTLRPPGRPAVIGACTDLPNVAIVDAEHTDGCRTVMLLRQLPGLSDVRVLSESPDSVSADHCLLVGANGVLDWGEDPQGLAERIATPADSTEQYASTLAARRRRALVRIAAHEAGRPPRQTVRLTALEAVVVPMSNGAATPDPLDDLGPAQQRLVDGLRRGLSYSEIAEEAGVTPSAVYRSKRRLARQLGMSMHDTVVWILTETEMADQGAQANAEGAQGRPRLVVDG